MTSVTHTQTRSVVAGPLYRVREQITASVTIDDKIFLFQVADSTYDHVCTVADMAAYPDTRAQAVTDGLGYYRHNDATVDSTDVAVAEEVAAEFIVKIRQLMLDYDAAIVSFAGSTTATIDSTVV